MQVRGPRPPNDQARFESEGPGFESQRAHHVFAGQSCFSRDVKIMLWGFVASLMVRSDPLVTARCSCLSCYGDFGRCNPARATIHGPLRTVIGGAIQSDGHHKSEGDASLTTRSAPSNPRYALHGIVLA